MAVVQDFPPSPHKLGSACEPAMRLIFINGKKFVCCDDRTCGTYFEQVEQDDICNAAVPCVASLDFTRFCAASFVRYARQCWNRS